MSPVEICLVQPFDPSHAVMLHLDCIESLNDRQGTVDNYLQVTARPDKVLSNLKKRGRPKGQEKEI